MTLDVLRDANLVIFGGTREPLSVLELDELKKWLQGGGRALLLLHEKDKDQTQTRSNLHGMLEEFGIVMNEDSVMRTVYHKYLHPKEVFISDGLLAKDLLRSKKGDSAKENRAGNSKGDEGLNFVYPYGSSLTVNRPARPILSSASVSFPPNRDIAAVWESDAAEAGKQCGRMVAIGSVEIFGDDWLDKEENSRLCDALVSWLLDEIDINLSQDRHEADVYESLPVPHIEALSQSIKPCLQGMDELPRDFTRMFDLNLFRFDTDLIPQTLRTYELMGVPHDPLTLIPPQFECPLPKLLPATFSPAMREAPCPALDQFDLDEHFAKETIRLAQLTNKCTNGDEDLEYYISESGEILGVIPNLPFGERSAKHILFHIFKQIVNFKRQDINYKEDNEPQVAFAESTTMDPQTSSYATSTPMRMGQVDLAPILR